MAMTKFFALFILALFAISMLATVSADYGGGHHNGGGHHSGGGHHKNKKGHGNGSLNSYECPGECNRRCSQTQYHNACILFCNKCCAKCLCVPPGFYGNKAVCPCYNNWKTQQGGPKCP